MAYIISYFDIILGLGEPLRFRHAMLPPAIKGQVVETELNINTSSEFHNDKIQNEVQEIEEYKDVQRKLGKNSRTLSDGGKSSSTLST